MKAIRIDEPGGPEALRYEEVPVPEMGNDQLLIKIYAVSINHLEMKMVSKESYGMFHTGFPWIPGFDFAGVVENAGSETQGFAVGDRVYGNCYGGSYAEYLVVSPKTVALKPERLTFREAATIPHVGETAWQAIHKHGQLQAGQKVLIHGAAGAVGAFAVQFARLAGADVYASVSGKDADYVQALGAGTVIDYETTDFTEVAQDMDLILVLVGGNTQEKSYAIIKRGGRLVTTTGPVLKEAAEKYGITGISMVIEQSGDDLRKISGLVEAGEVKTDVKIVYSLDNAAQGWRILQGTDPALPKITHGKIVLEVVKE